VCCEVLQFNPMHAKKNVETKEVVAYQAGKGLKKSLNA
jgi:nucleoid DNA-binding protein